MKNLKFFSLLLAIVFVAASAFTTVKKSHAGDPVFRSYQYNPGDLTGLHSASNWSEVTENPPSCSIGGIPCMVTFDVANYTDIDDYLTNHTSDNSILNDPDVTKKPQD